MQRFLDTFINWKLENCIHSGTENSRYRHLSFNSNEKLTIKLTLFLSYTGRIRTQFFLSVLIEFLRTIAIRAKNAGTIKLTPSIALPYVKILYPND